MIKAELDHQLVVSVQDRVGTLAEVTQVISSSGINLVAICAYAVDNKGHIMFVSEDNQKARQLLAKRGYDLREEEVVLLTLDNKPGTLQALAAQIADAGIDITLIYGSVAKGEKVSRIVLISEDNRAVLTAIKFRKNAR